MGSPESRPRSLHLDPAARSDRGFSVPVGGVPKTSGIGRLAGIAGIAMAAMVCPWARSSSAEDVGSGSPARPGPIVTSFPLRFDSEIIRLNILGDSLEVDGTYFFACQVPGDQPIALFYPFPKDSLLGGARMVDGRMRIGDGPWETLRFQEIPGRDGVRWWAPACPGDTIVMQGRYRQGLREKYARYIVTTTRAWRQPLRRARFEIRLPPGTEPVEFSFPFQETRDAAGVVYVWETESFYPDRDVTVRWR